MAACGWHMAGMKGGQQRQLEWSGQVHGDPMDLTSTRAEHVRALALVADIVGVGWKCDVESRMDDRGVVSRMCLDVKVMDWMKEGGEEAWGWCQNP